MEGKGEVQDYGYTDGQPQGLLGIRRMDKVPNARIRQLFGVTKGVDEKIDMKMFSYSSDMWKEWGMTGLLRGSMQECAGSCSVGIRRKRWIDTMKTA